MAAAPARRESISTDFMAGSREQGGSAWRLEAEAGCTAAVFKILPEVSFAWVPDTLLLSSSHVDVPQHPNKTSGNISEEGPKRQGRRGAFPEKEEADYNRCKSKQESGTQDGTGAMLRNAALYGLLLKEYLRPWPSRIRGHLTVA